MSYSRPAVSFSSRLMCWLGRVFPAQAGRRAAAALVRPQNGPTPADELEILQSARPLHFAFGTRALSWGRVGRPVALLVHGWSGRPTQFHALVGLLVAQGWRVVAIEAPGHGSSAGTDANVMDFTRAILEAAAELPDLRVVVGHSMGGAAALFACHLGLPAVRVVTLGAPASLGRMARRYARALGLGDAAAWHFRIAFDRRIGASAARLDAAEVAGGLAQTGMLVHDRDDREVPFSEAEALFAAWPQARQIVTRGLGHRRLLTDTAVLHAVVDFLRGSSLAAHCRAA